MLEKTKFSWKNRGRAFKYAWQGLNSLVVYEHNARIHCVVAFLVIIAGIIFSISPVEWCLVTLAIGIVLGAEALNTAVEVLADRITLEKDPLIGRAKDLGAFAVTISAIMAVVIGIIIFLPKLINMLVK